MTRAIVYYFRGTGEKSERYALDVIQSLRPYAGEVIVVSDEPIKSDFCEYFQNHPKIIVLVQRQPNPLAAYVYGIDHIRKLRLYDEVVCLSDSLMGPLSPADSLFLKADNWKCCAWGLALQKRIVSGIEEEFLSIDFFVIRKNLYLSHAIFRHIDRLANISYASTDDLSYAFSKYLRCLGCELKACFDNDEINSFTNPFFDAPDLMIGVSPFFWREAFYTRSKDVYAATMGDSVKKCLKVLEDHSVFDANILWDYILKHQNIADIHHSLKPDFVLPGAAILPSTQTLKCALLMHLYYDDILEKSYQYAKNILPDMDLLITTPTLQCKEKIIKIFGNIPCSHFEVRIVSARGRSESAFLLGFAERIPIYDCICFVHDKKTKQIKPASVGQEFWRTGMDGCLYSQQYIHNVVQTFAENPRLGLLSAYPTNVGQYYNILGAYEWAANAENVVQLGLRLGLTVSIDPTKRLISPFGSYFWFRPNALKPLLEYSWSLSDFPDEPVKVDGSLLHAIERIYPFIAQHMGYYSAYALPDALASILLEDFSFQIRSINEGLSNNGPLENFYSVLQRLR